MNPNGRIPVLRPRRRPRCLAESNAILWYLAEGSRFLPADPLARALTLQWMFFEQYSHEPNVAVARHWLRHVEMSEARPCAASREAGRRPGRARGHGAPPRAAALVRRGGDDRRGHRPLRLHPRGRGGRLRSFGLPERHRLARPGGGSARARPDAPGAGGSHHSGRMGRVPVRSVYPMTESSSLRVRGEGRFRRDRISDREKLAVLQ